MVTLSCFLRELYRQGRLTPVELYARLRALKNLSAGKLFPGGFEGSQ